MHSPNLTLAGRESDPATALTEAEQLQALHEEFASLQEHNTELKEAKCQTQEANEHLLETLKDLWTRICDLERKVARANVNNTTLANNSKDLSLDIARLKRQVDNYDSMLEAATKQAASLEAELKLTSDILASTEARAEYVESTLRRQSADCIELADRLAKLEVENAQIVKSERVHVEEIQKQEEQIASYKSDLEAKESDLAASNSQTEQQAQEALGLKSRLDQANVRLEVLRVAFEAEQVENLQLRQENERLLVLKRQSAQHDSPAGSPFRSLFEAGVQRRGSTDILRGVRGFQR